MKQFAGILALTALCASALADQTDIRPGKGAKDISIGGNLTFQSGANTGNAFVIGSFYTSTQLVFQAGIDLAYLNSGGSNNTITTFTGGARYYFTKEGQTAPYVLASLSKTTGSSGLNSNVTGVYGVGVERFFSPTTSGFIQVTKSTDKDLKNSTFVDFGLRFIFGAK